MSEQRVSEQAQPPVTGPDASPEAIEARRRSFDAVEDGYERVRAPWPASTLQWMLGEPAGGSALQVLDLGAGTGKATRTLAQMGHDVVAVDPSKGMLDALTASLTTLGPAVARRVTTRRASAEALPLADATVDAVTVLQAWHWFDEVQAAAEVARVLRPGGWLSMAWHRWGVAAPGSEWLEELAETVGRPEMASKDPADLPVLPGPFGEGERHTLSFDHLLMPAELGVLAASWSVVQVRPDRADVLARVRALGERVAAGADRPDRPDRLGTIAFPQVSVCYRFRRLAGRA